MNPKITYYKYTSFEALLSIGRNPKPPARFSVILYEERFLLVFVDALRYNKHIHTAQKEDTFYELPKRSHPNRTDRSGTCSKRPISAKSSAAFFCLIRIFRLYCQNGYGIMQIMRTCGEDLL